MIDLISKILTNVLTALYQPFWFAVLLSTLFMFFWLYSHEEFPSHEEIRSNTEECVHPRGYKRAIISWLHTFKTSSTFRRIFYLTFYTTMILFRTLLNRNLWLNPLSDVMGGWWIYDSNGELTTEPIENLMLFIPFTVLLMWAAKDSLLYKGTKENRQIVKSSGTVKISTVLRQSAKITFLFSFAIEFLQLFLRLGTWQLSDVFYNVLGGFIGGLVYWIMWRVKHRGEMGQRDEASR